MPVEFVEDTQRIEEMKTSWSALAAEASWPNVFYEPWYILSAAQAFQERITHCFVWSEQDADMLIGYVPLLAKVKTGRGRPRTVTNWHHDFCFSGQPLIAPGHEYEFWRSLFSAIDRSPALGSTLRLRGLKGAGSSFESLSKVLTESKRWHREYRRFRRAFINHTMTSDSYFQSFLTKKKRKEFRRQRRRLEDLGSLQENWLSESDDLENWLEAFLQLERSGWKGTEETAIASDATTSHFFLKVCRDAFAQDKLSIIKLRLDDAPVAMMITFLARPFGNFTYKIAYDEAFGKYSPGVLLELAYLQRFLGGDTTAGGWSDSCASEDHPMINKLWRERIEICSMKVSPKRPIARLASIYDDVLSRLVANFKN